MRTDPSGYFKFEKPHNVTVYVAFDRRATSLPTWMSGFTDTGDTIKTSLSSQGYLKVYRRAYVAGECVDLGGNHAPGSSTGDRSNYIVFYEAAPCSTLDSRFKKGILTQGTTYYTDRPYTITGMYWMYCELIGLDMIKTPNDDRYRTDASGYLTFTMPYYGTVYVAFDRRVTSLPAWMTGFDGGGTDVNTSLSSQEALKVFSRDYVAGACVDLGGNKAPESSTEERSNYIVFYRTAAAPPKEIIVDNGGSGTSSTGTWKPSGGQGSHGSQAVYSNASGSTYTFSANVTGLQDISMWWTWYASRCTSVPVKIYNGTTLLGTVYVNQQDNAKMAVWNKLGSYQFTGTAKVVIQATSSSCSTCTDAVKFLSMPQ
jgi:hypothetical protein